MRVCMYIRETWPSISKMTAFRFKDMELLLLSISAPEACKTRPTSKPRCLRFSRKRRTACAENNCNFPIRVYSRESPTNTRNGNFLLLKGAPCALSSSLVAHYICMIRGGFRIMLLSLALQRSQRPSTVEKKKNTRQGPQ